MDECDDNVSQDEGDGGPSTVLRQKEKKRRIIPKYGKYNLLFFFAFCVRFWHIFISFLLSEFSIYSPSPFMYCIQCSILSVWSITLSTNCLTILDFYFFLFSLFCLFLYTREKCVHSLCRQYSFFRSVYLHTD